MRMDANFTKTVVQLLTTEEVIMTSKREYFGSQDFFALDIPVT